MSSRIPYRRLIPGLLAVLFACGMFAVLNVSFGGPGVSPGDPYELRMTVADSKNLLRKSRVMIRGVKVGEVVDVKVERGQAHVSFKIDEEYAPLRVGARARVGYRTIFTEPFVDLSVGSPAGPALKSGSRVPAQAIVDPDEVLTLFDRPTRRRLTAVSRELSVGLRSERAGERLAETVDGLTVATRRIRDMTETLRGQEGQIGDLVTNGAAVVRATAANEDDVRRVVGSGRQVADILAARAGDLERTMSAFNGVAGDADTALAAARPALREAAPIVKDLVQDVADVGPAIRQTAPVTRRARKVLGEFKPTAAVARPVLRAAQVFSTAFGPFAAALPQTFGNAVPIARFMGDHGKDLGTSFANISDAVDQGDALSTWVRIFVVPDLNLLLGYDGPCEPKPAGLCVNPYPRPGDSVDPQPYAPGSYERHQPYQP